jgi:hypothetical protein
MKEPAESDPLKGRVEIGLRQMPIEAFPPPPSSSFVSPHVPSCSLVFLVLASRLRQPGNLPLPLRVPVGARKMTGFLLGWPTD